MQVCTSLPLGAATSVWQGVVQTQSQSLVLNLPLLELKLAQAINLRGRMIQAESDIAYCQYALSLPWLPPLY
uniref:Uncharacterized protein n=1 Tax=Arundo donax TaxID=35708 RepID=A0A0A8Z4D4_ARUDO